MYTLDEKGNRVYTLKVRYFSLHLQNPSYSFSSETHRCWEIYQVRASWCVERFDSYYILRFMNLPARFSPDDKFSRHRVTIKKRYNVLLTQLTSKPMWKNCWERLGAEHLHVTAQRAEFRELFLTFQHTICNLCIFATAFIMPLPILRLTVYIQQRIRNTLNQAVMNSMYLEEQESLIAKNDCRWRCLKYHISVTTSIRQHILRVWLEVF